MVEYCCDSIHCLLQNVLIGNETHTHTHIHTHSNTGDVNDPTRLFLGSFTSSNLISRWTKETRSLNFLIISTPTLVTRTKEVSWQTACCCYICVCMNVRVSVWASAWFLDASSHLYMRVCPSVCPSVRPYVRPLAFKQNRRNRPKSSGIESHPRHIYIFQ